MDIRSFVVSELSLFAYREGERLCEGSDDAKLAIAWIISNRVKAGWQSGDWLKVLESVAKHSASEPSEMLTYLMPDLWSPQWRRISQDCGDIYDGRLTDNLTMTPSNAALAAAVPGADRVEANGPRPSFFYANLQQPIRSWFMEKIIRSADHPRTVAIAGTLVLFG